MVLISMPPFGAQYFIKLLGKNKTYLLDKLEVVELTIDCRIPLVRILGKHYPNNDTITHRVF